jgi:surfactin synthase thioesterase subunit
VKGHHSESTEDIQMSVMQALNDIPHAVFQECYKEWLHHWKRCVQAQGMYFEGDHILVDEQIKLFFGTSLITLLLDQK